MLTKCSKKISYTYERSSASNIYLHQVEPTNLNLRKSREFTTPHVTIRVEYLKKKAGTQNKKVMSQLNFDDSNLCQNFLSLNSRFFQLSIILFRTTIRSKRFFILMYDHTNQIGSFLLYPLVLKV